MNSADSSIQEKVMDIQGGLAFSDKVGQLVDFFLGPSDSGWGCTRVFSWGVLRTACGIALIITVITTAAAA